MSADDPHDAELTELLAKLKLEWVPNRGQVDPMDALARFAVKLWLARQGRGNVQAPGPEEAEEHRAAG